ncbi:mechanosensitive ion channel family protein [Ferrimonas senticii]|uniref:mechanosensitive ion channel family protein n=1 Tax=Ferrimonas senticii TaxID=394566 RepID=UPI0003F5E27D|nr:mechanosensitive ion channel family protein [Ferrimonas senticii]
MSIQQQLSQWMETFGVTISPQHPLIATTLMVGLIVLAWLSNLVTKALFQRIAQRLMKPLLGRWLDGLERHRLFDKLARLVPITLLSWGTPLLLAPWPKLLAVIDEGLQIWLIAMFVSLVYAVIDSIYDAALKHPMSRRLPLQSMSQLLKLFLALVAMILIVSVLLHRSPTYLLSGLGVATGLLLLVFRDTILGFVAGIQLSINRMVSPGDWIQMDSFGADGEVLEVTLTTVKVQNWDKTITMIPAYALVSNAFRNWRGMSESGGRRIKRAVYLDQHSIRFVDSDLLTQLQRINLLKVYLQRKLPELAEANAKVADFEHLVNGRRITNVGCLRAYLVAYLQQSSKVRQDLTLLVRQLAPSEHGVPLEVYCFCNDTRWVEYEALQSDLFDHLLAILPQFDLRAMQLPTGADLRALNLRGSGE